MDELFQVTMESNRLTVSARELYEFLELEERFSKWFERMVGYGFTLDIDYTPYQKVHPQNNQVMSDYQLTVEMAKHLCMIQRTDKGKQAREYFIQLEKDWNSPERVMARALEIAHSEIESVKYVNRRLEKEVTYKEDVIIGLVENIDLATKRRRISEIVRHNGCNYENRFKLLYREFEMKYQVDLNRRMISSEVMNMKPKIKNKMDYIDRCMHMIPQLYELCCKLFENDIENIKKTMYYTVDGEAVETP